MGTCTGRARTRPHGTPHAVALMQIQRPNEAIATYGPEFLVVRSAGDRPEERMKAIRSSA